MSSVKKSSITAVCIALCYIVPLIFHAVGSGELGKLFSPMHLPVLLCGLICGPLYGGFCGIAGPVLSSLAGGMPPPSELFYMIPELMVYGLAAGLLMKVLPFKNLFARLYVSLIPAMIAGRIVGVLAKMLFISLGLAAEVKSFSEIAYAFFVFTLPGAAAQLILIPPLVFALKKARLIEI